MGFFYGGISLRGMGVWSEVSKRGKTMNIEETQRDLRLDQLDILRQSLEQRDKRILELETKVEVLEVMLNRSAAFQGRQPQPQPLPAIRNVPRRWSTR
jgi:hypothetical protein